MFITGNNFTYYFTGCSAMAASNETELHDDVCACTYCVIVDFAKKHELSEFSYTVPAREAEKTFFVS